MLLASNQKKGDHMSIKPRIFIGSSKEALSITEAIQENLDYAANCICWTQGIMDLSHSTLESILETLNSVDFAIFVLTPDDALRLRGNEYSVARDNVIFEFGLFTGRLGRNRCFLVAPRAVENFHIPSDLLGITMADYDEDYLSANPVSAVGSACAKIKRAINKEQVISQESETTKLIGCYEGSRDHYRVGAEVLEKPCRTVVLLQHSSSILLGPEGGCPNENHFFDLLHKQIQNGTEFYHVTSLLNTRNHYESPKRSYPNIENAINYLDRSTDQVRLATRKESWPIRVIPGENLSEQNVVDMPAPILFVEPETGSTEGIFIAHVGNNRSCFHMHGSLMNSFYKQCIEYYFSCHVLNWQAFDQFLRDISNTESE